MTSATGAGNCYGSEPQSPHVRRAGRRRLPPGLRALRLGRGWGEVGIEAHPPPEPIQHHCQAELGDPFVILHMSARHYDTPAGQVLQGTGVKPSISGYSSAGGRGVGWQLGGD